MVGKAAVTLIVQTWVVILQPTSVPGILNVILSAPTALLESVIACRSDPGPLFAVLVTIIGGAACIMGDGTIITKNGIATPKHANRVVRRVLLMLILVIAVFQRLVIVGQIAQNGNDNHLFRNLSLIVRVKSCKNPKFSEIYR